MDIGDYVAMDAGLLKSLMFIEAFFGNFYVAITRGLFIPMLTYSGYSTDLASQVTLLAALIGIIISYVVYTYPSVLGRGVKVKLLVLHVGERVGFALLPFLINYPLMLAVIYAAALTTSMVVSILITIALMEVFRNDEFVEVSMLRSAAGAASAILGSIYSTSVTAFVKPPESYYIAYVTAAMVGLVATVALVFYRVPRDCEVVHNSTSKSVEVEVRKANTFLMITLMMAGGNLVGLAWPQLLRAEGFSISLTLMLNVAGNLGGVVGPYIWRGYKMYVLGVFINTLFTSLIPVLRSPALHVSTSAILSASFMGANLIASAIYAKYAESLGIVRASTLISSSNAVGLFIASIIGMSNLSNMYLFMAAALFKALALLIALIGIPETSVVPAKTAFNYGKLIYSASVLGYTFTVETSRHVLLITLQILTLTFILMLILFIYRFLILLSGSMY